MVAVLKKSRKEDTEVEALAMANCLLLLSRVGETASSGGRVFECKTCKREFSSFQALGGHRASHKKAKQMAGDLLHVQKPKQMAGDLLHVQALGSSPAKPKTHQCSICCQEFAVGQALGGHMRRHRAALSDGLAGGGANRPVLAEGVPFLEKSSSGKRVVWLDLNLTPFENEMKISWMIAL